MTSKRSFFKLLVEDQKQRLWSIVLAFIVIILPVCIAVGMIIGGGRENIPDMQETLAQTFNSSNIWLYVVAIVGAYICAECSFGYLFSEKKVDFYHALPIKRTKMFTLRYLSGVLVYLIPSILMTLISLVIIGCSGFLTVKIVASMFSGLLYHLFGFLLIYSTAVLAIMLVGNIVVFLMISGWILGCVPLYLTLFTSMEEEFFQTFSNVGENIYATRLETFRFLSPATFYCVFMPQNVNKGGHYILQVILMILAITGIGLFLYLRRPSEGAKKAIVSNRFKPVLRISIELISGIALSNLFHMMISDLSRDVGWMIFGAVLGVVLSHMLMETIFNYDIKKCFHGKISLIACAVAAVAFSMVMRFDSFSYDQYLPKENKVESVGIVVSSLRNNRQYDFTDYEEFSALGTDAKREEFMKTHSFRMNEIEEMKLTDSDMTLPFIQKCIQMTQTREDELNLQVASVYNYENYQRVFVRFTLKNGKKVYRQYCVSQSFLEREFGRIFENEEYKKVSYSLDYTIPVKLLRTISVRKDEESFKITLTKAQKEELFEALRVDLAQLTWEEKCSKNILFLVDYSFAMPVEEVYSPYASSYYRYSEYNGYSLDQSIPIYPSFTNTIAFMKKHGLNIEDSLDYSVIDKVTLAISNYEFEVLENGAVQNYRIYTQPGEDNEKFQLYYTLNEGPQMNANFLSTGYETDSYNYKTETPFELPREYWEKLIDMSYSREYEEYQLGKEYCGGVLRVYWKPDEYGNYRTASYYLRPNQDLRFLLKGAK